MKFLLFNLVFLTVLYGTSAEDPSKGETKGKTDFQGTVAYHCPSTAAFAGITSDLPFLFGATYPLCNEFGKEVCQTMVQSFEDDGAGSKLSAGCQLQQRQIVKNATLYDNNGSATAVRVQCCSLASSLSESQPFQRDSSSNGNTVVNCGPGTAVKRITVDPAGETHLITLTCVTLGSDAGNE